LCRLALDGLIGFSSLPLSLAGYAGLTCAAIAVLCAGWLGVQLIRDGQLPGWGLVTLALLACSATQLLSIGILSEYVRRIFLECKARPTYIVGTLRRRTTDGAASDRRSAA
jgi:hypothetical protein